MSTYQDDLASRLERLATIERKLVMAGGTDADLVALVNDQYMLASVLNSTQQARDPNPALLQLRERNMGFLRVPATPGLDNLNCYMAEVNGIDSTEMHFATIAETEAYLGKVWGRTWFEDQIKRGYTVLVAGTVIIDAAGEKLLHLEPRPETRPSRWVYELVQNHDKPRYTVLVPVRLNRMPERQPERFNAAVRLSRHLSLEYDDNGFAYIKNL